MAQCADRTSQDFVLRALAASEIAESCTEPRIRESFFALAEDWLREAGRAEAPEASAAGLGA